MEEQKAWDDLKEFLNMPDLATYMDNQPLHLEVDVSENTIRAVLLQH